MNGLFVSLLLLATLCLLAGMIRPSIFSKVFKGTSSRKKVGITFGTAIVALFILVGATSPKTTPNPAVSQATTKAVAVNQQTSNNQTPAQPKASSAPAAVQPTPPPSPETDEQKIGDVVKSAIGNTDNLQSDWSFKDASTSEDYLASPDGALQATVEINVGSIWDKSQLMIITGDLSSKVFQGAFGADSKIYDIIINYYGTTTDSFGNQTDEPTLRYMMDGGTFAKINFQNFNTSGLCDFLNQPSTQSNNPNADTECLTLANIK